MRCEIPSLPVGTALLEVRLRVERFDRRPIEPFEFFTSEFGQNAVRIQENSSKKIQKISEISEILNIFSSIQRKSEKFSSESVQNSMKKC